MNIIDLIIIILLAIAAFDGWRRGFAVQLCTLLGVFVAIWIANGCGTIVGRLLLLGDDYEFVGGFILVFVTIMIGVFILSRMLKKIFRLVGLGVFDMILGCLLSVCKCAIILSLVLTIFDSLNNNVDMVKPSTISESRLYNSIMGFSGKIFPALKWTQEHIEGGLEKL